MQPDLKPVPIGETPLGRGISQDIAGASAQRVLRNTYMLLGLTMIPTALGALVGMASASLVTAHPIISTFATLGAVMGLQYGIAANRDSAVGIALLLLMTGLLGWWLGPILDHALALRNGIELVGYAAVGTGVIFFAMAAVATTTKRDFGFLGSFLFVGMIALLVAMLANMWLQIAALALTISTLVIVVFSLFLLYDLNRVVRGGETNYVIATTGVYMSLYNVFANLLMLLLVLGGDSD